MAFFWCVYWAVQCMTGMVCTLQRTSGDDGEGEDGDGAPDHEQVSDPECSDEATDEDVPTEKAELQRRIRELKKVRSCL